jgi:hypothetical protein
MHSLVEITCIVNFIWRTSGYSAVRLPQATSDGEPRQCPAVLILPIRSPHFTRRSRRKTNAQQTRFERDQSVRIPINRWQHELNPRLHAQCRYGLRAMRRRLADWLISWRDEAFNSRVEDMQHQLNLVRRVDSDICDAICCRCCCCHSEWKTLQNLNTNERFTEDPAVFELRPL